MSSAEEKSEHRWPFCVAALSVLVVLYFLSFGPFCWLEVHGYLPESMFHAVNSTVFAPCNSYCFSGVLGSEPYTMYVMWWAAN